MLYWLRRILVFVCLVVGPLSAALVLDALVEISRDRATGLALLEQASKGFQFEIELESRRRIEGILLLSEQLAPKWFDSVDRTGKRKEELLNEINFRLEKVEPENGFAWLVDGAGRVMAGTNVNQDNENSVARHPLFLHTQQGSAVDQIWRDTTSSSPLVWGAGAPLVEGGVANGAIIVGWAMDHKMVNRLASALGRAEVSLIADGQRVIASSLQKNALDSIMADGLGHGGQIGGTLQEPLSSPIPGLPLVIGPSAEGLAFSSLSLTLDGTKYSWLLSVPLGAGFQAVADRQLNMLAIGVAMAMIVILFSVIDYRTYIAPIVQIERHLSEIQLGRGEVDLPEGSVSQPFRRLVRLINMTIQKLPKRNLSVISGPGGQTRPRSQSILSPLPGYEGLSDEVRPANPLERPANPLDRSLESPANPLERALERPANPLEAPAAPAPMGTEASDSGLSDDLSLEPRKRSANEIRGATPKALGLEADGNQFYEVSQFTAMERPPSSSVRSGGSLELSGLSHVDEKKEEKPASFKSTAVAAVEPGLLAASAQGHYSDDDDDQGDMTVVANVDPNLLSKSASDDFEQLRNGIDESDWNHFKEVYSDFLSMREQCGERTSELGFDRFLTKLQKNRAKLVEKYNCKTVRFQVYEKDGKAALKATPVRSR